MHVRSDASRAKARDSVLKVLHSIYKDGCLYSGLYAAKSALAVW